jgi:hypothetical protein
MRVRASVRASCIAGSNKHMARDSNSAAAGVRGWCGSGWLLQVNAKLLNTINGQGNTCSAAVTAVDSAEKHTHTVCGCFTTSDIAYTGGWVQQAVACTASNCSLMHFAAAQLQVTRPTPPRLL